MTLNDATFVECSEALANRLIGLEGSSEDRVRFGFLAVTSRAPSERESAALTELYDQCRSEETPELQAWTAVASVLLNLDEIMSK